MVNVEKSLGCITKPREAVADKKGQPSSKGWEIYRRALLDAFVKLNPRWMLRNPVMFVTEVGSVLTTALWIQALSGHGEAKTAFIGGIALWLWLCVLFANFSEALAEGRGKAQAAALRRTRRETRAKKLSQAKYGTPLYFNFIGRITRRGHISGGLWGYYTQRRRDYRRYSLG